MYTETNFRTGKELREAVAKGDKVRVFQPNADLFGKDPYDVADGIVALEGPHYPQPHKWYVEAEVKGGVIVKVKK